MAKNARKTGKMTGIEKSVKTVKEQAQAEKEKEKEKTQTGPA